MKFILFVFSISQAICALAQAYVIKPLRINPTTILQNGSEPLDFCDWNSRLYFSARKNKLSPYYLFSFGKTDTIATDKYSGTINSPGELTPNADRLLFKASDPDYGMQLRSLDFSDTGVSCLTCGLDSSRNFIVSGITVPGSDRWVYYFRFKNSDLTIAELWKSNLDNGNSRRLGVNFKNPGYLKVKGEKLFLQHEIAGRQVLMVADTSGAGFKRLHPDLIMCTTAFAELNGEFFFGGVDTLKGLQLWKTDGSLSGTSLVKQINQSGDAYPSQLTVIGQNLYFTANDGVKGFEVWSSDGTPGGTVMLTDKNPQLFTNPQRLLTAYGNRIYFTLNDGIGGEEIWSTDALGSVTRLLKDFNPGSNGSECTGMKVYNNRLFFILNNGTSCRLWVSDGTEAGTKEVKIIPGVQYDALCNSYSSMQPGDGALYVSIYTADHGYTIGRCTFDPNSSLNESKTSSEIYLYPNPVTGRELYFSKTLSGIIVNSEGRYMSILENTQSISLTGWPCGVYCLIGKEGMVYRFVIVTD